MKISKALRPNRDLPQLEVLALAAAAAGTGADFEHAVVALPNLAQGAPSGTAGMVAENTMTIRWLGLLFEATLTGAATNNFTVNILQRRAGAPPVNTTSATTITAGTQTFTPASLAGFFVGAKVVFSGGTGATETVTIAAVNTSAGTATATFVNGHSGAYTIVSAPLATITYGSGVNESQWVPHWFAASPGNYVLPGDVITVQRVSAGTGLASPSFSVIVEWENYVPR